MRDPEPCRLKHTEDTEQQTVAVYFSFFINSADGYNVSSSLDFVCCNWKII